MSISQEDLFKIAFNLKDPWFIVSVDFSAKGKKLDIRIDFKTGSKFAVQIIRANVMELTDVESFRN